MKSISIATRMPIRCDCNSHRKNIMKNKLIVTSLLLISTVAFAESLEEKKYWKGETDYVNKAIESANEACGVKFTFDWIDKTKFRSEAEKADNSPNSICSVVIDQVASLCRDGEDEKTAVKGKIKGFRCGYGKPRSLDLTGGILKYLGNNDEANFSDWAKPWLTKKL
jgi:hypothetical protein